MTGAHVVEVTSGELSANGITLRVRQADNLRFDFGENTVMETGLVFQYQLPGTGVVLMDRDRLVWNIDPETGEMVGPPVFEAGPHPFLHGDLGHFCAVLTLYRAPTHAVTRTCGLSGPVISVLRLFSDRSPRPRLPTHHTPREHRGQRCPRDTVDSPHARSWGQNPSCGTPAGLTDASSGDA